MCGQAILIGYIAEDVPDDLLRRSPAVDGFERGNLVGPPQEDEHAVRVDLNPVLDRAVSLWTPHPNRRRQDGNPPVQILLDLRSPPLLLLRSIALFIE
jgi:hypothetical protein